jgi:glycosyltransferase involved in cell wall biosynthesis
MNITLDKKHRGNDVLHTHRSHGQDSLGPNHGKIALVHDWLAGFTGGEKVLQQMLVTYAGSDVFTLVDLIPENDRGFLEGSKIVTSFIQRLPFARKKFRAYLSLMPLAVEQFNMSPYDVVISSSWAVAKGVLTREDQLHLCYSHTPIRYAWDLYHDTLAEHGLTRGVKGMLTRCILHYLRLWDFASAARVDGFAANSHYVARRIWKTYRRKARVIYPPVDIDRFAVQHRKEEYYVTVSRLVPYKRIDLMIEAFRRMPDRKLVVVGDGPEYAKLAGNLPSNVTLLGQQPTDVVVGRLQSAKAFLFAANEDFGIAPVEAQACGTPVIAFGHGGATESVVEGKTGIFFPEQTAASIVAAVEAFENCGEQFDPSAIRAHAESFSPERFRRQLAAFVEHHLNRRNDRKTARLPVKQLC